MFYALSIASGLLIYCQIDVESLVRVRTDPGGHSFDRKKVTRREGKCPGARDFAIANVRNLEKTMNHTLEYLVQIDYRASMECNMIRTLPRTEFMQQL